MTQLTIKINKNNYFKLNLLAKNKDQSVEQYLNDWVIYVLEHKPNKNDKNYWNEYFNDHLYDYVVTPNTIQIPTETISIELKDKYDSNLKYILNKYKLDTSSFLECIIFRIISNNNMVIDNVIRNEWWHQTNYLDLVYDNHHPGIKNNPIPKSKKELRKFGFKLFLPIRLAQYLQPNKEFEVELNSYIKNMVINPTKPYSISLDDMNKLRNEKTNKTYEINIDNEFFTPFRFLCIRYNIAFEQAIFGYIQHKIMEIEK